MKVPTPIPTSPEAPRAAPEAGRAARPPASPRDELALPPGTRLGGYEIQEVLARSASTIVYIAADHGLAVTVAIQEYLPTRFVRRDPRLALHPIDPWQEDTIGRGRQAFVDEARILARCDHPSLVRVVGLFEANGTAYRVMPVYRGERLTDRRRAMSGMPSEASLRELLDDLLGAVDVIHATGQVHGGVTPSNILLLSNDMPLLLGAGAAGDVISTDLVDSLMANLEGQKQKQGASAPPVLLFGAAADVQALARVVRFCMLGEWVAPDDPRPLEPLSSAVVQSLGAEGRSPYSEAFLSALEAAVSPLAGEAPLSVALLRGWLERAAPQAPGPEAMSAPLDAGVAQNAPLFGSPKVSGPNVFAWPPAKSPAPEPGPPATLSRGTLPTDASAPTELPDAPAASPRAAPPVFAAYGAMHPGNRVPPTLKDVASAAGPAEAARGAAAASERTSPEYPSEPPWHLGDMDTVHPGSASDPMDTLSGFAASAFSSAALPPKLTREAAAQRKRRKLFMGIGFAALAVAVLGVTLWSPVMNTLDPAPAIHLDPSADAAAVTDTAASAPVLDEPLGGAADSAPTQTSALPLPTPPLAPPELRASPPGKATLASGALAARSPDPTAPGESVTAGSAGRASPRSLCAPRTEFALYRCMEFQCRTGRWWSHPQCVRLRSGAEPDE